MSDILVAPLSRKKLRDFAETFRKIFGLTYTIKIPIVQLLDVLAQTFNDFSYQIIDDTEADSNIHAYTDINTKCIYIKESVYNGAYFGCGRDRMTIAHEIGHFLLLCLNPNAQIQLQRNFIPERDKIYCSAEWQAKCFAAEFLISKKLTKDMTPIEIANSCGVSLSAAEYQYNHNKGR